MQEKKPYEAPAILDQWELRANSILVTFSLDATFNEFDEADEVEF